MSNGTVDTMLGVVPVVITGGILMKFAEAMLPTRNKVFGQGSKRKKNIYSRKYSGNFSNIGF